MFQFEDFPFDQLPPDVGRLRYRKYIQAQGKSYDQARHDTQVFYDQADAASAHLVCRAADGTLLSAVRVTPFGAARQTGLFHPALDSLTVDWDFDIIASRLVRADVPGSARSIKAILEYTMEFCARNFWFKGLIQTSPRLEPLFVRHGGWARAGATFQDPVAGPQVPLCLDLLAKADGDTVAPANQTHPVPASVPNPGKVAI